MTPKEIYEAYHNGDVIDDVSLVVGMIFYKDLADKLNKCGPMFKLAGNEANNIFWILRQYAVARKLKLPEGL